MVRLTVDLIGNSMQFINTVRDRELSLRACKIPVLENLGVTRDQFDTIDLTDNDIRKLENIPLLKRLSSLIMHNNRVQQIMANFGDQLPSLVTLALTNNNLCELGDIDPLALCQKLEYLTLIGNPVTHKPHYRLYVIYKCPSVRVLDFKRVRLAERKQAQSMFKGKKGQKAREQLVKKSTPLTESKDDENTPRQAKGDDAKKIQDAIASASTLAEVEHLQTILQSGKVPDKEWNVHSSNKANNGGKGDGLEEFVVETEEENDGDGREETMDLVNEPLPEELAELDAEVMDEMCAADQPELVGADYRPETKRADSESSDSKESDSKESESKNSNTSESLGSESVDDEMDSTQSESDDDDDDNVPSISDELVAREAPEESENAENSQ